MPPRPLSWFAAHELRLVWRDFLALMSGGRRLRTRGIVIGLLIFFAFLHLVAYVSVADYAKIDGVPTKQTLAVITGSVLLSWAVMLAEAMESVTRGLYARADLDLILSSPVPAWRVFSIRMAAMVLPVSVMSMALAAPFIDILVWFGGPRWFGAYGVILAMGISAVAMAVLLTLALFHLIGARRTRFIAQVLAAVIGAAFVIGLQIGAILHYGTLSRTEFLRSQAVLDRAPDVSSVLYWPGRAVLGDGTALTFLLTASFLFLALVITCFAPRYPSYVTAAAGVASARAGQKRAATSFRNMSASRILRHKEWILIARDPWLMSQTLMQLLYLVPPAVLLWRSFARGLGAPVLLVPVLVMAAGQLAGGLAWLAISGEDAPELIATAPVTPNRVLRAKIEAVIGGVALIFCPFVAAFAFASPGAALLALLFILIAAGSSTIIQLWFRAQAKRSNFRRRQTSSRFATIAEAFSSVTWAATGALAAIGSLLAIPTGVAAVGVLVGTWFLKPTKT